MSEEKKNYLLCVDASMIPYLATLLPKISYVEFKGMPLTDQPDFLALITPLPKAPEEVKEDVGA